jgi:hypothetical protein
VIYVLNLIRNVGVIYMMDTLGWSYQLAHHEIGRTGSLIALIVLAAVTFKLLPELLDNIWGLIDLKDRDKVKEEEKEEEKEESEEGEGDEEEEDMEEEPLSLEEDKEVEKTPVQAG